MSGLFRFGVSLDRKLLEKFDRLIRAKNYTNRSKAISDLIRQELIKKEWQEGREVAGAITLIYDHHRRELADTLMDIQHDSGNVIVSTQHIHLSHHTCLEIIAARGRAREVKKLSDRLQAIKGVQHVALSMSSAGKA